jgi:hypothetical protein
VRQLASVVGSLGLILAAYLALAPVSVDAPHADGRCGPPLVRVAAQEHDDDPNAQAIVERCEETAGRRLVLAVVSTGVGTLLFLALRVVARRRDVVRRRRRRAAREAERDAPAAAPDYISS